MQQSTQNTPPDGSPAPAVSSTDAPSATQLAEQLRTDGSLRAGDRAVLAQQVIAAVRREDGGS
jgi:hypothetical protein